MRVDISSPGFKADPFPFYGRLRASAPVHPITLPDGRAAWLVARYDDVAAVLKDERFAKDPLNALTPGQQAWPARPAGACCSPSHTSGCSCATSGNWSGSGGRGRATTW